MAEGHVEWLKLVDVSGPFLSLSVLGQAFPQGLDADDPDLVEDLRAALTQWDEGRSDRAIHRAFVRFMLERVLGYAAADLRDDPGALADARVTIPEHAVALSPDFVVARVDASPALLVAIEDPGVALERASTGRFSASPAERMRLLLRGSTSGVLSGLLTNGERWMFVHAPHDRTPTFATFDATLFTEERITLRAFYSLLGARRVVGQAPGETLDGLLKASADDEREVTDALGDQARRAVEVLVAAFDAADRGSQGRLLQGVEPPTLYEAIVTVAMRLIFLLAAEAQELLPIDGVWAEGYAVTPLRAQLLEGRDRGGDELLARRMDAWPRLSATFRAVHGGVEHDRAQLPGYGGGLFDPERYPFLERDREGRPPRISNADVLHVLDDLQTLEVAVPGGRQRRPLSFAALGVEQIGHVYERLLEHWALRAEEPALGLRGTGRKEPEIGLRDLEETRERGEAALLDLLVDETGRGRPALEKDLAQAPDERARAGLRAACDNDEDLLERVEPFASLVRHDAGGTPCVYLPGRIYVTERPGGRAFQSHYTPRALTEEIVEHALAPLVFEGPAEGWERDKWHLRGPAEILGLRVCDIAVGSAAFLVAACRYLAARLVESWEENPAGRPPELPSDPGERDLLARRLVAERCLYGVDKNPLAIDIAKVSLWLATLRRDRPFTFLDHALRTGDSLVGITDVAQLEYLSLADRATLLSDPAREGVRRTLDRVRRLRIEIAATDALDLHQVERKQAVLAEADRSAAALRMVADLVASAAVATAGTRDDPTDLVDPHSVAIRDALAANDPGRQAAELLPVALRAGELLLAGRAPMGGDLHPFHWPLEFPEVFDRERGGFDAIIGNPPFLGGRGISGLISSRYREHLVHDIANGVTGAADLCAYFFLRGAELLREGGSLALLATNTIAQGDTREVGLGQMTANGATIMRATPSRKWPGEANLEIAQVWLRRGAWGGEVALGDRSVSGITPYLSPPRRATGDAHRLVANAGRSFIGSYVLGLGFVLSPAEAEALVARGERNGDVLFPYLTGEDLQSRPDQSPSRWVINFGEMAEDEAREYREPFAIVEERVYPERATKDAVKYPRMVFEWWKFWNARPALNVALSEHPLAFARSRVSNTHAIAELAPLIVASEQVVAFIADDWGEFAAIQSSLHEAWVWRQASSMRTDIRYTPSDCFETFPFARPLPPGETAHEFHDFRASCTRARNEGLTKLANRMNDPAQNDADLARLRELLVEMDRQVSAAYGWDDLDLGHGFHDTRFGRRFTLSEAAREEVVDRLLELNHARHAEEVAQGLHAKGGAKKRAGGKRATASHAQESLLGDSA